MGVPGRQSDSGLRGGEGLAILGGVGMAVASLVPWYKVDQLDSDIAFSMDLGERTNGWQVPDAILSQAGTVLGAVVALVVLLVSRQDDRPSFGGLSWGTTLTGVSVVAFGLIALKYGLNTDGTTVGIYGSLLAGLIQLYGAYVVRVEERGGLSTASGSGAGVEVPPTQLTQAAQPVQPVQPTQPAQPVQSAQTAQPAATSLWPETAYLLAAWLQPGSDPATAAGGYRTAFAGDPARLERLRLELQALLDPHRPESERRALVAAAAPHAEASGAQNLLAYLAYHLFGQQSP